MIKQITHALLLSFLAGSAFANISGIVGGETHPVKGVPYAPDAVVFENKLVVFYQVNNDKTQGVFSVATADEDGHLVWIRNYNGTDPILGYPYTFPIDKQRLHSEGIAPAPVFINEKLYVFGRVNAAHNKPAKIIYNAIDTLGNLMVDNNWNSYYPHVHGDVYQATQPDSDRDQFAVINYRSEETAAHNILMTYYAKGNGDKISYSNCEPDARSTIGGLQCVSSELDADENYNGAPHLMNIFEGDDTVKTYLYVRNKHEILSMHEFVAGTGFLSDNTLLPNTVKPSPYPLSTAVTGDSEPTTHLYYKKAGSDRIYTIAGEAGTDIWDNNGPTDTGYATEQRGIKTVVYNDRAYVFYVDKQTGILSYFSDTMAAPVIP